MADIKSAEVQKSIVAFVKEMDASMLRASAERDFQKEAVVHLMEKYELDKQYKKILRKIATTYHRSNYNTIKEDEELFQTQYELIFNEQVTSV